VKSSEGVKKGGYVMMLTATSYLLLQGPAQYFEAHHEDTTEVRTRSSADADYCVRLAAFTSRFYSHFTVN